MTQALEVRALDIIDGWLRTGQVHPAPESIKSRIQMAATTGEIGLSQSSAMIAIVPQLVSVAAKIALADQYHFLKKSDVDPSELDIVEESLNRLYDVLVDCEDESMVMIHKLLYDFIDKLRKDSQHAQGGEQLDYSHGNDVNDLGVEIGDSKQAPSEVSQGSGGGQSHVN